MSNKPCSGTKSPVKGPKSLNLVKYDAKVNPEPQGIQNTELKNMATWLKDHMTRQGETMNKISDGMEHLNMNMVTKVEFDEFKSKAVTVDNMKSEVAAAIEEKNQAMVDDLREAFDKKIKEFEDKAGDVAVGRLRRVSGHL